MLVGLHFISAARHLAYKFNHSANIKCMLNSEDFVERKGDKIVH